MKRRTVVQSVAIGSVGLTAGCFGRLSSNPGGSVLVHNDDGVHHQITVKLSDNSGTVFEEQPDLNPSESVEYSDAFGSGSYDVTVTVDGENTQRDDLNVGSCGNIRLHITVTDEGTAEIQQGHCD